MSAPVLGYEVRYRIAGSGAQWTVRQFPADSTTITIPGLSRGINYEGEARSLGPNGLNSGWVGVTFTVAGATLAPRAPTGLTATAVADGVALAWSVDADQRADVEYAIERATASGGPFAEITRARITKWTDPTGNATTYFYRVRAVNFAGVPSAYSSVASAAGVSSAAIVQTLSDIANDNLLTPSEKSTVITDVAALQNEQAGIDAQASSYGITTEKTAYDNAMAALNAYLGTLTSPVAWNSTAGNTTIVGATFRTKFTDVYSARQALLNKIVEIAKILADTAGSTASLSNYAKDGSFEGGGQGWLLGANAYIDTTPGAVFVGTKCLSVSGGHAISQSACPLFRVTPGDTFIADCMIQNYMGGANGTAQLKVWGYDVNGTFAADIATASYAQSTATYTGTTWRACRVSFKVPANVLQIRIGFEVLTDHTTGYWCADLFRCAREDQLTGNSANLALNTQFGGINGSFAPWGVTWNPQAADIAIHNYRDTWTFGGSVYQRVGRLEIVQFGVATTGPYFLTDIGLSGNGKISVIGGKRYEIQCRAATYRCRADFQVYWYDAAMSYISEVAPLMFDHNGGAESGAAPLGFAFVRAPANAAYAYIGWRKYNTDAGQPNSVVFVEQPYFGVAAENQVEPSQYADGAVWSADQLTTNAFGVVSATDLYDQYASRRVGLRVPGSGHRVGDNRNLPMIMVGNGRAKVPASITYSASAGTPATATISVSAFTILGGDYSTSYSASSVGVSGTGGTTVQYYLYMNDPAQTGGALTLVATTNGNDLYSSSGRLYIGDVSITFPTSGSAGGGGGRDPNCVTEAMWMGEGVRAGDVVDGMEFDVIDLPRSGTQPLRRAARVLSRSIEECVRLTTRDGFVLECSRTTPFDLPDGGDALAPDMVDELVWTDDGWQLVESVEPIGLQPVIYLSFGGASFPAGSHPDRRIYSHNLNAKP